MLRWKEEFPPSGQTNNALLILLINKIQHYKIRRNQNENNKEHKHLVADGSSVHFLKGTHSNHTYAQQGFRLIRIGFHLIHLVDGAAQTLTLVFQGAQRFLTNVLTLNGTGFHLV